MTLRILAAASALALIAAGCVAGPPPAPPAIPQASYSAFLISPGRPEADKTDDAARKPAEVLAFAQVRPGDTVLELEAGRGWYSELLSQAVGPTGRLIIQFPPEFGYGDAALKARTDAGRLKNAVISKSHFDALDVASGSVDKVVWILGPHEIYYKPKDSNGLGEELKTYTEIVRVLKPGGKFIAMDHAAAAGTPTTSGGTIHRIDPAVVLSLSQAVGLKYTGKNEVLANPADDRTKLVFDSTIRRHTDQFLFAFQKPYK
jgi:predicted methyltransferase